jgi:nucleoside 2-deoxyribosyltransferase
VDDGTAWEIGYFCAKRSPEQKIIGMRTDSSRAGESEGARSERHDKVRVDWLVMSREELLEDSSILFEI